MENKREDDRFSNQSLLNLLARSQSSRTQSRMGVPSSSSRSTTTTTTGQMGGGLTSSSSRNTASAQMTVSSKESNNSSSRRRDKDVPRERDTLSQQSTTSRHSLRELSEKISNGANIYVSFSSLYLFHLT